MSLQTPYGTFRYRVQYHKIVKSDDWGIIRPQGYERFALGLPSALLRLAPLGRVRARRLRDAPRRTADHHQRRRPPLTGSAPTERIGGAPSRSVGMEMASENRAVLGRFAAVRTGQALRAWGTKSGCTRRASRRAPRPCRRRRARPRRRRRRARSGASPARRPGRAPCPRARAQAATNGVVAGLETRDRLREAGDLARLLRGALERRSAGRTKSSKQTRLDTGFPGTPNTSAPEGATPNQSGFPGLCATRQKTSRTPSASSAPASRGRGGPPRRRRTTRRRRPRGPRRTPPRSPLDHRGRSRRPRPRRPHAWTWATIAVRFDS